MSKTIFDFYRSRIESAPNYGFKSGHEILTTVTHCAFCDSTLTLDEFNSIINLSEHAHIKMMEDNYNAGWQDNQ